MSKTLKEKYLAGEKISANYGQASHKCQHALLVAL